MLLGYPVTTTIGVKGLVPAGRACRKTVSDNGVDIRLYFADDMTNKSSPVLSMMRSRLKKLCCRAGLSAASAMLVVGLIGATPGWASGLDLFMGNVFSGTPASGSPPWAEASFRDVSPGMVLLTITNLNLTSSEKVTELYLNLNPALNPTSLQFTLSSGSSGVGAPQPSLGVDGFKADGDGKYDILFAFDQQPVSAFSSADYLTYTITGIPTLTSLDFNYLSSPSGGHGPFVAAMHVQGLSASGVSDTNSYSGWISPIPEPGPGLLLLSAGSAVLGLRAWRRRVDRS